MNGDAAARQFTSGGKVVLRGEEAGEGSPIVLCHGLTATRRSVIHGSRRLERGGFTTIAYDARGHGDSDPAPAGAGYGYPELIEDLDVLITDRAGGAPVVIAGHSMGAHTAVAFALCNPGRVAALVLIGPTYIGPQAAFPSDSEGNAARTKDSLAYWDGLAEALERDGIDGFVAYIGRTQEVAPPWCDSVLRFTRERMQRHRHLEAIVRALREVPRSQPFGKLAELELLSVPTLVVASHDAADPGHPYAIAAEYARRIPAARLVSEGEGQSPLAWQGGRLSREIENFCRELQ